MLTWTLWKLPWTLRKYGIKDSLGLYLTRPFFWFNKFVVYFTSCTSNHIGYSLGVMYTFFSRLLILYWRWFLLTMIVNLCRSLSVIHKEKVWKKHLVGKFFVKMVDHACLFQVSPCGVIAMICYVSCHLYLREKKIWFSALTTCLSEPPPPKSPIVFLLKGIFFS